MIITICLVILFTFGLLAIDLKKNSTKEQERMKKRKLIHLMTEVGIFTSIGLVLDYLASVIGIAPWANGGSISIAMVPIFIVSYRQGIKGGLLTGLLIGVIQMMWSEYLVHPIIPFFDYILPYTVLGLAGAFSKFTDNDKVWVRLISIPVSIIAVCILRLGFHTISGMVAWNTGFVASIVYNFSYLSFNVIICSVICMVLTVTARQLLRRQK